MATNNDVVVKVNADTKNFLAGMNKAKLAMVAMGAAVAAGIGKAISAAAEIETITTRFETLTGSVEVAQDHVKELLDFSAKTPFQFQNLAETSAVLQAFGTNAKDVTKELQQIGDVAAATGKPIKELGIIYGQVRAAGKLTGERLLQLLERGVPIMQALAKEMNVAESSVRGLITAGEVTDEVFARAFATLSEEGGFAFRGMEKQSQGLNGKLSTMKDNFAILAAEIGEMFIPAAKWAVDVLIDFAKWAKEVVGWTNTLFDSFSKFVYSFTSDAKRIEEMRKKYGVTEEDLAELNRRMEVEKMINKARADNAIAEKDREIQTIDEKEQKAADKAVKNFFKIQDMKSKILKRFFDQQKKRRERQAAEEKMARDSTLSHVVSAAGKHNAVGQAAAVTQTTISGHESAQKAYTWGVGLGGPPLGALFAGISAAFTAKQLAAIAGVGLYDGGTVLDGMGRSRYRDSVPARLSVGETVISRGLTERLQKMTDRPSINQIDNRIELRVDGNLIVDDDDRVDMLIERINERVEDGNARLVASDSRK